MHAVSLLESLRSHVSDSWYYAENGGHVGPLTLRELRQKLAAHSKADDVLVWCDRFADWKRAKDVPEFRAQAALPPPPPSPEGKRQTALTGAATPTVVVVHRENAGVLAGVLGCAFGVLGIFSFGIFSWGLVFVPLAALCTVVGLLRGLARLSPPGIGVSLLSGILTVWGFIFSPSLWLFVGGFVGGLVGSQSGKPTTPATSVSAPASLAPQLTTLPTRPAEPPSPTWPPEALAATTHTLSSGPAPYETPLLPRGSVRPSFDCATAKSAAARLICADKELAQLDSDMAAALAFLKTKMSAAEYTQLMGEQLSWLRMRNENCGLAIRSEWAVEMLAGAKACVAERLVDLTD
jgi:uncharacterized protein YecT (DUF1311 family)